jgi:hypothetical protein
MLNYLLNIRKFQNHKARRFISGQVTAINDFGVAGISALVGLMTDENTPVCNLCSKRERRHTGGRGVSKRKLAQKP